MKELPGHRVISVDFYLWHVGSVQPSADDMSSYEPHVGPRQNLPWNLQTMSDGLQGGGYISMAGFYTGPKKVSGACCADMPCS